MKVSRIIEEEEDEEDLPENGEDENNTPRGANNNYAETKEISKVKLELQTLNQLVKINSDITPSFTMSVSDIVD